MKGKRVTKRELDIYDKYISGNTYTQIGNVYGICMERVRQIFTRTYHKITQYGRDNLIVLDNYLGR